MVIQAVNVLFSFHEINGVRKEIDPFIKCRRYALTVESIAALAVRLSPYKTLV